MCKLGSSRYSNCNREYSARSAIFLYRSPQFTDFPYKNQLKKHKFDISNSLTATKYQQHVIFLGLSFFYGSFFFYDPIFFYDLSRLRIWPIVDFYFFSTIWIVKKQHWFPYPGQAAACPYIRNKKLPTILSYGQDNAEIPKHHDIVWRSNHFFNHFTGKVVFTFSPIISTNHFSGRFFFAPSIILR